MLRRAATQLVAASARVASVASASASGTCGGGVRGGALTSTTTSAGIASTAAARSFASSGAAAATAGAANASYSGARVRPLLTLAWAAATALATTTLLSPSGGAAKAEEAAEASTNSSSSSDLYSLPRETTGLFSPSSSSSSSPLPSIPPLTLYQYEVCPFCCKVKAVLDYYGIPYRVVEVSPLTKRQLKWGEHRKVPVLALGATAGVGDGGSSSSCPITPAPGVAVLADSSAIISRIAAEAEAAGLSPRRERDDEETKKRSSLSSPRWWRSGFGGGRSVPSPPHPPHSPKEAIWRKWVDGRLVKVITVNIYRTGREARQTFEYISEAGDFGGPLEKAAARVVGAGMMWAIAGRLAKKYGVEGDPRAALEHAGREWTDGALRKSDDACSSAPTDERQPFAGGDAPDLSDLSAFGVWRAVAKTDSFEDAMRGNARLREWYGRMEEAVGPSARVATE